LYLPVTICSSACSAIFISTNSSLLMGFNTSNFLTFRLSDFQTFLRFILIFFPIINYPSSIFQFSNFDQFKFNPVFYFLLLGIYQFHQPIQIQSSVLLFTFWNLPVSSTNLRMSFHFPFSFFFSSSFQFWPFCTHFLVSWFSPSSSSFYIRFIFDSIHLGFNSIHLQLFFLTSKTLSD
jgi:hypothetical protein